MISITAEGAAGMSLEEAISQSINVAKKLDVCVQIDINRVRVLCLPDSDVQDLVKRLQCELKVKEMFMSSLIKSWSEPQRVGGSSPPTSAN